MDTLAVLSGNQDIYTEMKKDMNERLADHQKYIDESIKEYAEGHADSVVSLTDLSGINDVFRESVKLSKGEDAVKDMEDVLASSGGRIQVMFIENNNRLSVFDGKIVWGHAGTYVTVFALESEKDTEKGRRKIVARIFHEIWARSRRAKDLYDAEIKKKNPKTAKEVKEAAEISRRKYEKEVNQVVSEIKEFGYISSPNLQEVFSNLRFENKIDFINRDFAMPGEKVAEPLKPDFVMAISPEKDFKTSDMNYDSYSHSKFISKHGEYFVYGGKCWSVVSGKPVSLPFKGEIFDSKFSPKDEYLAVGYNEDTNTGEIIDVKLSEALKIDGLAENVKSFSSFSYSGKFIAASLPERTVQIINIDERQVVKTISYNGIIRIDFSRHDKYAAVKLGKAFEYKYILFDMKTKEEITLSDLHGAKIQGITVSPDEKYAELYSSREMEFIYEFKTKKTYNLPPDIKSQSFISIPDSLFILYRNGDAGVYNFKKKTFKLVTSNVYRFQDILLGDTIFISYDDTKIKSNENSSALYYPKTGRMVLLNTKNAVVDDNFARGGRHFIIRSTTNKTDNLVYNTDTGRLISVRLNKYDDKPFFSADGNTLVVFSPTDVKLYDLAKPDYIKLDGEWDPVGVLKERYGLETPMTAKEIAEICKRHETTVAPELRMLREMGLLVKSRDERKNNPYLYSLNPILQKAIDEGNIDIRVKKAIAGTILKRYALYIPKTIGELVKNRGKNITTVRREISLLLRLTLLSKSGRGDKSDPCKYRLHPELEMVRTNAIEPNILLKTVEPDKNKTKGKVTELLESLHEQNSAQTAVSLMQNLDSSASFVKGAIKLLKTLNLIKEANTDRLKGAFSYELSSILKGFTDKQMQAICGMKDINGRVQSTDRGRINAEIIKKINAVIHDENVRLAPIVPSKKVLWHVFAYDLMSYQEQFSGFGTQINKMSEDKNGTEKIKILNKEEKLEDVLKNLAKDSNNIVHVMIKNGTSLEDIPKKIKIAIFGGEVGDCSQIIGMMAVSRALAIEDISVRNEELCRLYKLLTGESFVGQLPKTTDPKKLANAITFHLPAILVVGVNELPILRENTIFYLKHA